MGDYKFPKDKLAEVIGALKDYQVFAPRATGDVVRFKTGDEAGEVTLEYANTSVPAKEVLFPQTETLFKYRVGDTEIEPDVPEASKRLIFGVRPCDAMAFSLVERLYNWDFPDPYWQTRRDNTVLFGLACAEPQVNCFCTSLDGGPASETGLDALMFDLGETVYIKTLTDAGEDAAKAAGLEAAGDAEKKAAAEQAAEAEGKVTRSIDTSGIPEKLPDLYDHPFWEQFSDRCLSCGICTFLCPTCHCFDIQDEVEGFDGRRARMWDSCMFPEYTVHTSGHNPRPTRKERTRNRISHKYSYFPEKFEAIACVGCGRCTTNCPVNIDILDVLEKARQAEAKEAKTA